MKVQVHLECPVCGFYKYLGTVEGSTIYDAMRGERIPFKIDYRAWSGGRAKGISQKGRLNQGYVPKNLMPAWLAFVKRIEAAYEAVRRWLIVPRSVGIAVSPRVLGLSVRPKGVRVIG